MCPGETVLSPSGHGHTLKSPPRDRFPPFSHVRASPRGDDRPEVPSLTPGTVPAPAPCVRVRLGGWSEVLLRCAVEAMRF